MTHDEKVGTVGILYIVAVIVCFFVGAANGNSLMAVAVVAGAIPVILLVGMMWLAMVLRFSPNPVARLFFGALTLTLFGTGIGWFVNLVLFLWVMDSKPDIFTGEPLAQGPKREAWLAQRRPTVNIDARQVHVHHR